MQIHKALSKKTLTLVLMKKKTKQHHIKTTHEYHLMKDTAELIIDAYGKGSETAKEQVKKNFLPL